MRNHLLAIIDSRSLLIRRMDAISDKTPETYKDHMDIYRVSNDFVLKKPKLLGKKEILLQSNLPSLTMLSE